MRRESCDNWSIVSHPNSHHDELIEAEAQSLASTHFDAKSRRRASIAAFEKINWRAALGKYLKLSKKDAELMDMVYEPDPVDADPFRRMSTEYRGRVRFDDGSGGALDGDSDDDDEGNAGDGDEDFDFGVGSRGDATDDETESEGEADDELGVRWKECETLSVAYLYVKTIESVFEGRVSERDIVSDFESVYDLVIDAIDSFEAKFEAKVSEALLPSSAVNLFHSKKQQERLAAEMSARKASAELKAEDEIRIGTEVLAWLKAELDALNSDASRRGKRHIMVGAADSSATTASDRAYRHQLAVDNSTIGLDESKGSGNEFARELLFITKMAQEMLTYV